jgi:hypothetical protein
METFIKRRNKNIKVIYKYLQKFLYYVGEESHHKSLESDRSIVMSA